MKTVHSVILPVLIILLLVTPSFGSDWVTLERYDNGDVFSYNKVKIKHIKKKIVQVWVKFDYSDEGRKSYIHGMKKYGGSTEGYSNLSQTKTLYRIDCKNEMRQIISSIDYDEDGQILGTSTFDKTKWTDIVPGSTMGTLRNKVCKSSKNKK
jgi:hypothetical protein